MESFDTVPDLPAEQVKRSVVQAMCRDFLSSLPLHRPDVVADVSDMLDIVARHTALPIEEVTDHLPLIQWTISQTYKDLKNIS